MTWEETVDYRSPGFADFHKQLWSHFSLLIRTSGDRNLEIEKQNWSFTDTFTLLSDILKVHFVTFSVTVLVVESYITEL